MLQNHCLYQQQLLNATPTVEQASSSFLALFLNQFFERIGLEAYWHKTSYGLQTQINELLKEDRKQEALNLLLKALKKNYFWFNHPIKWWQFMHQALNIIQDPHLPFDNLAKSHVYPFIKLCSNAPQPWQGHTVAYCFAALSLWCFQAGKVQKAIEYIYVAIHADAQWGYPEYLLGWYGLQLEGIDPVPHFARAIHQNEHFLHQLQQDPLCQYFPKMVKTVKQFLLCQTGLPKRHLSGKTDLSG